MGLGVLRSWMFGVWGGRKPGADNAANPRKLQRNGTWGSRFSWIWVSGFGKSRASISGLAVFEVSGFMFYGLGYSHPMPSTQGG